MTKKHKHIYNSKAWKALRRDQLASQPLCQYCLNIGLITPATVVDHVIPHKGDLALAHDCDNLQSLCKECHDRHADAKDHGKTIGGCDTNGMPTDINHEWFKEKSTKE